MYRVRAGQFILSGIDARNGAFGVVPAELDGAVITNDFWTHNIDTSIIDPDYFYWLTSTSIFYDACKKASEGTTNRQRLQTDKFYGFEFALPSTSEQRLLAARLGSLYLKNQNLLQELNQQQSYLQLLRQTLLQEAIQGKLTQRDPADEPASELLRRIKAEKAKLVKEGKLKKEKELPLVTQEEMPFELPEGWVWCRLGDLCLKIGSGSTPRGGKEVYKTNGVKFIRSQNVYDDGLNFENIVFIDAETHSKMASTKVIGGDLLLNITGGSIGRCSLVSDDFDEANVSQHVTILRTSELVHRPFLHIAILSPFFQDYIMDTQTGGNREGLAKRNLELMLIPIPSKDEQRRIELRLTTIFNTVYTLNCQIQESHTQSQSLLQTLLKEAFSTTPKAYAENEALSLAAES